MLPASSAKRLCSHGRSASAIPCRSHGQQTGVARSPLFFRAEERPDAGQRNHAAGTIGIDGEAVKDGRRRERDRRPAEPGGRTVPRSPATPRCHASALPHDAITRSHKTTPR